MYTKVEVIYKPDQSTKRRQPLFVAKKKVSKPIKDRIYALAR